MIPARCLGCQSAIDSLRPGFSILKEKNVDAKSIFKSRTFWFALLFALVNIAGLFGYQTYQPDAQTTEIVGVTVSVLVIILRFLTKQPIT